MMFRSWCLSFGGEEGLKVETSCGVNFDKIVGVILIHINQNNIICRYYMKFVFFTELY